MKTYPSTATLYQCIQCDRLVILNWGETIERKCSCSQPNYHTFPLEY